MMLLVSCGGQQANAPETPEKKNVEEVAGEMEATSAEQEELEPTAASGKVCSDFPSSQYALEYYETDATPAEKKVLDSDGDGLPCNEAGVAAAGEAAPVEKDITLEELEKIDNSTSYGKQLVSGLGNCQLIKYQAENGERAYDQWLGKYMDDLATTPAGQVVSIQEEMIRMGYSCTESEAMVGMPAEE